MVGCDAVFHVAADYRLWARDPAQLFATNVDGTMALLRVAARAGVGRFVYTSSVSTLKVFEDGRLSDESIDSSLEDMVGAYKRSKFLAEREVLAYAATTDMEVIVVNPSTPVGPGDVRPTPTGKIADAAAGKIPAYVNTGLNIVHVDVLPKGTGLHSNAERMDAATYWVVPTCRCRQSWPRSPGRGTPGATMATAKKIDLSACLCRRGMVVAGLPSR